MSKGLLGLREITSIIIFSEYEYCFLFVQVSLGTPGSNITQGVANMSINPAMITGESFSPR